MTSLKLMFGVACLALPLISSCASSETEPRLKGVAQFADDPRLGEETNSACFSSQVDGFSETTRDTVVLELGRKHFLVEVFGACSELRNAMAIGVDSSGGCVTKGDHLIVSNSVFANDDSGLGPQSCAIKSLYEWDPEAKAESE